MENKPQPKPKTKEKKSGKGGMIFLVILTIALAGLSGYLVYKVSVQSDEIAALKDQAKEQSTEIEEKEAEITSKDNELEEVLDKYRKVRDEREQLGLDNKDLNEKIATLEKNITKFKGAYYRSEQGRKELERTVAQLKLDAIQMQEEIERWKTEAEERGIEVAELQAENQEMTQENEYLEGQVAVASVLKAEGVKVAGINDKGKRYDKQELKNKQMDKVEITFTLAENNVAKQNVKDALLRIIEPSNTVLFDLESGGGSFEKANGQSDFFTSKQMFKFSNSNQRLTFLYQKGSEYKPGTYRVEVYCEGHLIGKTAFKVK